jgi:hypothetical protein
VEAVAVVALGIHLLLPLVVQVVEETVQVLEQLLRLLEPPIQVVAVVEKVVITQLHLPLEQVVLVL